MKAPPGELHPVSSARAIDSAGTLRLESKGFGGFLLRRAPYLLFFMPTLLFADEVYLRGAGTISGRIVEQTETMIMVNVGDGIVGVPTSRVERIEKGRSPLDDYDARASQLGPQDVDGWRRLGLWALQQGLSKQSRQAYEKVLAIAPDDAEARGALGYVLLDGRWLTEEDGYRARGYVKYDGEWMTPAEAQMARASAEADQARRDAERRAIDAEIAAENAQARAQEAEERAREAESNYGADYPLYWGGWGYGVTYWPSTPVDRPRPPNRPAQRPAGGRR